MSKHEPLVHDWREWRRRRAWYLYEQGWQQKEIAQALGVSKGAVSQWINKAKQEGTQGLRRQPCCGCPAKLSQEQRAQLPELLAKGAEAFGFSGAVWTTERVAAMINQQFGVSYHPAHCSRLLRACHYSRQKPVTRATQRDEQRIEAWKREQWPAIKKAMEEKRIILFVDEAGFALLPLAVLTYASCGQTPILPVPLTHDHLSGIGALSMDGRLFMRMQRKAYKGPDVIRFLRLLLRKIPGKLLIIWDGASIHRCQALKDFLAQGAARRLHLEALPGYARRPQSTRRRLKLAEVA